MVDICFFSVMTNAMIHHDLTIGLRDTVVLKVYIELNHYSVGTGLFMSTCLDKFYEPLRLC